jgi:WD40 repeat protein
MRPSIRGVAVAFAALVALAGLPRAAAPPYPDLARLVRGLGDEDIDVRESCTQALTDCGDVALPAVQKALTSKDVETRRRAARVLAALNRRWQVARLTGHTDGVIGVAISHDGKQIASGGQDGTVRVWDLATAKQTHLFRVPGWNFSVAFSPDDKTLASGGGSLVQLWDLKKEPSQLTASFSHSGRILGVAFSPDGKRVASAGQDGQVVMWDVAKRARLWVGTHNATAHCVAFCPDGKHLVSGGYDNDKTLVVWAADGTKVFTLKGHTAGIVAVAVSPDGKLAASAAYDKTIRLWDLTTGKEIRRLEGHTHILHGVAFTPDGKRLVSGSGDMTVGVWDVKTGKRLRKMTGHSNGIRYVAVTPDGKHAVSASADKTLIVWRLP